MYKVGKIDFEILISHNEDKDKYWKKNHPKSSILRWVVAFWSLKVEKAHFEKIEIKVFGATFEKRNYAIMYIYRRINDGSELVFNAD